MTIGSTVYIVFYASFAMGSQFLDNSYKFLVTLLKSLFIMQKLTILCIYRVLLSYCPVATFLFLVEETILVKPMTYIYIFLHKSSTPICYYQPHHSYIVSL